MADKPIVGLDGLQMIETLGLIDDVTGLIRTATTEPIDPDHLTSKQYVDRKTGQNVSAATLANVVATLAPASEVTRLEQQILLKADQATLNALDADVLHLTGGVMSGQISMMASPVAPEHVMTLEATEVAISAAVAGLAGGISVRGTWTPATGGEYPPAGQAIGDSYVIVGVGSGGYTFTAGSLAGGKAFEADQFLWTGSEWALVTVSDYLLNLSLDRNTPGSSLGLQMWRSNVPGERPGAGILPGEPYINEADDVFGVVGIGGGPIDMAGPGVSVQIQPAIGASQTIEAADAADTPLAILGTPAPSVPIFTVGRKGIDPSFVVDDLGHVSVQADATSPSDVFSVLDGNGAKRFSISGANGALVISDGSGANQVLIKASGGAAFTAGGRTSTGLGGNPSPPPAQVEILQAQSTIGAHIVQDASQNADALRVSKPLGNTVARIGADGSFQGTGAYVNLSDARLKSNIRNLPEGLSHIMRLRPTTFRRLEAESDEMGFIAQEVREILPNAVIELPPDWNTTEFNPDFPAPAGAAPVQYLGVRETAIIPVMVHAIQELAGVVQDQGFTLPDPAPMPDDEPEPEPIDLTPLHDRDDVLEARIDAMAEDVANKLDASATGLIEAKDNLASQIQSVSEQFAAQIEAATQALNETQAEHGQTRSLVDANAQALSGSLADLEGRMATLEARDFQTALDAEIAARAEADAALHARIDEQVSKADALQASIDALNAQLQDLAAAVEADREHTASELNRLDERASRQGSRIRDLEKSA